MVNACPGNMNGTTLQGIDETRTECRAEHVVQARILDVQVDEYRLSFVSHCERDGEIAPDQRFPFSRVGAGNADREIDVLLAFGKERIVEAVVIVECNNFIVDLIRSLFIHNDVFWRGDQIVRRWFTNDLPLWILNSFAE